MICLTAVAVHDPLVAVTVYVVVELGAAVTCEPVLLLSDADGLHEKVLPEFTDNVTDDPRHIEFVDDEITRGERLVPTFTVDVTVPGHPFVPIPVTV